MDDPLIYVRAIHFAATITVAGAVFFVVFIAEPAFRGAETGARLPAIVRHLRVWVAWTGLVVTVVSGLAPGSSWSHNPSAAVRLADMFTKKFSGPCSCKRALGTTGWCVLCLAACLAGSLFRSFQRSRSNLFGSNGLPSPWPRVCRCTWSGPDMQPVAGLRRLFFIRRPTSCI